MRARTWPPAGTVSHASLAQLVEQLICNQQVVGSIPTAGSLFLLVKTSVLTFIHAGFLNSLFFAFTLACLFVRVCDCMLLWFTKHTESNICMPDDVLSIAGLLYAFRF